MALHPPPYPPPQQSYISTLKQRLIAYLGAKRPAGVPRFSGHISFRAWIWLFVPPTLRILAYDALKYFGIRLYGESISATQRLPLGLYLRKDPMMLRHWQVSEVHALCTVQRYTTIPVPTVLDVLVLPYDDYPGDEFYLLISELPGERLDYLIEESKLSPEDYTSIAQDLKDCLLQLRKIPSPTNLICSASGGPFVSLAISRDYEPFPTFDSVEAFHASLREQRPKKWCDIAWKLDPVFRQNVRSYKVTFTHGDLNPTNILVRNGRLSGLIDWEFAGYLPEYWEYSMSLWADRYKKGPFRTIMDLASVEDYAAEMEAFQVLSCICQWRGWRHLTFLEK